MTKIRAKLDHGDPFDLQRFINAQEGIYARVLSELQSGQKRTHWMWYIFPQIDGLGYSTTSKHYAIKSIEEARAYLAYPILGSRLLECTATVLAIEKRSVADIFGYPDDLKLKSCMTLFATVAESGSVFSCVLDKYFQGKWDDKTLYILAQIDEKQAL
ncbi:MAG: DUF1810 domain-containing protein [Anaerolineae bacterium]|nr:DUF1810 domain-containing protein [Anaerolineae bacterium]